MVSTIYFHKILCVIFGLVIMTAACSNPGFSPTAPAIQSGSPTTRLQPTGSLTPLMASSTSTEPAGPSASTQVSSPTADTRPTAKYWREWPIDTELSARAQALLHASLSNPDLDVRAFSKVGDCQMTTGTFLGGYANGKYLVPDGYQQTVAWFSTSLTAESITAANGLGISSVLNPMFGLAAGYAQCERNETPLDCELRLRRPAVVLITMGTNWKPAGEVSFDKYLRIVVDRVLASGALPVLGTKADNIEGDWKLDQVIAQVANDYDLPLVNVWRSVQGLPNHGLEAPKNIYLTPDGWMQRNYAWLVMLEKIRQILARP